VKKLSILIVLILGITIISKAQNNSYGLSAGIGNGVVLKEALEGDASYRLNTGFSIGLQYSRKLTNKLHLMTGINWYNNSIKVTPAFHPGVEMAAKTYDVQLIYIPLLIKASLGKYFFIDGGFIGDVDVTNNKYITNQSGLGASLGMGIEFPLSGKFFIQLNPYLNFHGLLLTDKEDYSERIFDSGIKLNFIVKR
jgi:hypothetical protein